MNGVHLFCPKCNKMVEVLASVCNGVVKVPLAFIGGVPEVDWGNVKVIAKPDFICSSCELSLAKDLKDLGRKVYADPHYSIRFGGIVKTKEGLFICGEVPWDEYIKIGKRLALYPISKKAALKVLKDNKLPKWAIYRREQFSVKEVV